jgi:hypothetical protein
VIAAGDGADAPGGAFPRPEPGAGSAGRGAAGAALIQYGSIRHSASRAQKIARHLLCVSDGRLSASVNPAFRGPSHSVHRSGSVIIAAPRNKPLTCDASEPPIGIEPMTYALRGARSRPAHALAAPITRIIALTALAALGLSKDPFHEPFHTRGLGVAARHAGSG